MNRNVACYDRQVRGPGRISHELPFAPERRGRGLVAAEDALSLPTRARTSRNACVSALVAAAGQLWSAQTAIATQHGGHGLKGLLLGSPEACPETPGRTARKQITTRLDADVLAWLKAGGKDCQSRMNAILRQAMLNGKEPGGARSAIIS